MSDFIVVMSFLRVGDIINLYKSGVRDFSNSKFFGIELSGANLSGADFSESKFEWVRFVGTNLGGGDFSKCDFQWCNFSKANLTKTKFHGSKIYYSLFDASLLADTNFENCDFNFVGFLDTNLTGANFTNASKFKFYTSILEIQEEDISFAMQHITQSGVDWSRKIRSKAHLSQVVSAKEKLKMLYDARGSIEGGGPYIQPSESLLKTYSAHKGSSYDSASHKYDKSSYEDVKQSKKEKSLKTEYE